MNPLKAHTSWGRTLLFALVGSLAVALLVLAFLWPSKTSSTKDLPLSVAGPEASVTAVEQQLETAKPGAFDFHTAANRDEAVTQIKERTTYGALVINEKGVEVLTAPAAGSAPAQMLTQLAQTLQAQLTAQATAQAQAAGTTVDSASLPVVTVTQVVPLSNTDPNGTGLAAAAFPLALGGMIGGVIISMMVNGPLRRVTAVAAFSVLAGVVLVAIMQGWFGYLQGNALMNMLAMAVTVMATSSFIVGATTLLGTPGIALGAVITVLLGNPLSGATMPWQFLPSPWGVIGQGLVPGAGNTLIRTLSYFPDASTAAQWWTLIAWVALGLVLLALGSVKHRKHRAAHAAKTAAAAQASEENPQPQASGMVDTTQPAHAG